MGRIFSCLCQPRGGLFIGCREDDHPQTSSFVSASHGYGSSSLSLTFLSSAMMTSASKLRSLIWLMNSLHLPHGGIGLPPSATATIFLITSSPPVTIAATALCSAQNPMPLPVSMQTPTYTLSFSVTRAQPTSPTLKPCLIFLGFKTDCAFLINSSSLTVVI